MKMTSLFLLLLCLLTFQGYSQEEDDQTVPASSDSPFESSPFSSTSRNHYSRCRYCGRYHAPSCNPPNTPVPIDGGLTLLLAGGAAYGVKRFRRKTANDQA